MVRGLSGATLVLEQTKDDEIMQVDGDWATMYIPADMASFEASEKP